MKASGEEEKVIVPFMASATDGVTVGFADRTLYPREMNSWGPTSDLDALEKRSTLPT